MSQYYYLVASLPMLRPDGEPPMSVERFFALCREHVSPEDMEVLDRAGLFPGSRQPANPQVLNEWYAWESALRNDLVRLRAHELGLDQDLYLRETGFIGETAAVAREALAQGSPADTETALFRARFAALEGLEVGHYFDLERLVLYLLKLKLLIRRSAMTDENGRSRFGAVYEEITEPLRKQSGPAGAPGEETDTNR